MSPTTIAVTNHDPSPVKSPYRYDANCAFRYDDKKIRNKQVNRVLLQPHWRNDADFLPTSLPS